MAFADNYPRISKEVDRLDVEHYEIGAALLAVMKDIGYPKTPRDADNIVAVANELEKWLIETAKTADCLL